MIDRKLQKLMAFGKTLRMTDAEKNSVRMHVARHMRNHPAGMPSLFIFRYTFAAAFAFLIFLGSGGAVTFAAQKSLPGGTLYPIKRVSEEIKKIAMVNPTEKAVYDLNLIEKRFDEVNQLISENALTKSSEQIATDAIKDHIANIDKISEKLATIEPAEALLVHTKLTNTLKTGTSILLTLSDTQPTNTLDTKPTKFVLATYETAEKSLRDQKTLEAIVLSDTNVATVKTAEKKYTAVLALLDTIPPVQPEVVIPEPVIDPVIDIASTATLIMATPASDSMAKSSALNVPEPTELELLISQMHQAYAEKKYGTVIILAEQIEHLITSAEKVSEAEKEFNIVIPETTDQNVFVAPVKTETVTPSEPLTPLPEIIQNQ